MDIFNMPTKDLIPYPDNAKRHDEVQVANVANSISRYGWVQPLVVDENNVVVIGHCRLLAAKRLGLDEVPVTVASGLTDDEVKELRIADNRLNESQWDWDILDRDRQGLAFEGFQFDWVRDEESEEPPEPETVEDNFDPVDDVPEESDIQPGDLFQLGRHYVLCGDSTNADDIQALMNGVQADLLLTDPPYNVDYGSKQANQIATGLRKNKWLTNRGSSDIENDVMNDAAYVDFLTSAFKCADMAMRPGSAFYIWYAAIQVQNVLQAIKNAKWAYKQQLIWVKNNFALSRMDYHYRHEPCWYGWKPGTHYFTPSRSQTSVIDDNINIDKLKKDEMRDLLVQLRDGQPSTVLYEDRPLANDLHPTMKPIKLMARLIINSTKPGDTVLDIFGGSGSTMMACEQLGRTCYTVEAEPKYVAAMLYRFQKFTGKPVYRLEDGEPIEYVVGP